MYAFMLFMFFVLWWKYILSVRMYVPVANNARMKIDLQLASCLFPSSQIVSPWTLSVSPLGLLHAALLPRYRNVKWEVLLPLNGLALTKLFVMFSQRTIKVRILISVGSAILGSIRSTPLPRPPRDHQISLSGPCWKSLSIEEAIMIMWWQKEKGLDLISQATWSSKLSFLKIFLESKHFFLFWWT